MYRVDLKQAIFPAQTREPFKAETIYDLMCRQARQYGSKSALEEVLPDGSIGRTWSYRSLHEEAIRLGCALASRHPRASRIAIYANNRPEWVLLELAAAYAGLIVVTVNPSLRATELRYILEQSGASAIYYAPHVRGSDLRATIDEAVSRIEGEISLFSIEDERLLFSGSKQGSLRDTTAEDVVQIQYTSGTTGFPKGAQLHQAGLVASGRAILQRAGVTEATRSPGLVPLFHTSGCGIMVLGSIACGATLLLPADFDPNVVLTLFKNECANFLSGVPTMLVAILDAAEHSGANLSGLSGIMSGGAMVAAELNKRARRLCGKPIQITYGMTEASPGIAGTWPEDKDEDVSETIGQPYPHMDVAIMDRLSGAIAPLDTQGEICVRGYNVMREYNQNPKATRETIDKSGWLHTGDLGTMDARGYLKITGRVKDMIIRGGENLFPAEIENVLLAHPDIAEVAVVGVPDNKWGELVACFMRSASSEQPAAEVLKQFVRQRLSPQKTPSYWVWVDEWPLTGSGKIQKFVLQEQFVSGSFEVHSA
nr:putative long-chain-fatty-acid--CoA ligase [uncultured bacterium]